LIIKNYSHFFPEDLEKCQLELRKIGLSCLEKSINAVKPEILMKSAINIQGNKLIVQDDIFDLEQYKKIYIIGGGKATAEMAFTLEKLLDSHSDFIRGGIINIPQGLKIDKSRISGRIDLNFATHPIPNENGLKGTKKMMEIVEQSSRKDLIICLISGGGSALLPLPKEGVTLEDLQIINSLLLASGASIHEINTVRKHLSDFKGGNLAKKLYNTSKATLLSLIISDVVGNKLDSIASGPTVPDLTTFNEAIHILEKYKILNKIPTSTKNILEQGLNNEKLENPKPNDACFDNVHNYLIGSVKSAAEEAISYLESLNYNVHYFSNEIIGEAHEFGNILYQMIKKEEIKKKYIEKKSKIALIGTGELTVTIKGNGIGGRNQEMLLSLLLSMKNDPFLDRFVVIAANLDGIEGNSEAMGAIVDTYTLTQVDSKNLNLQEYLDNNDSNGLFKILRSEIITGPTGCNVNDLIIVLFSCKE